MGSRKGCGVFSIYDLCHASVVALANQIVVFLMIAFQTCRRQNAEFSSALARLTGHCAGEKHT